MLQKRDKKSWILLAVMLAVALMAPQVLAQGGEQAQIEELRSTLDELEENDRSNAGTDDIARARQWLDEGEQLLSQRSHQAAEYRLRRVDHTVDLVRELIEVGNIELSAQQQEERYEEIRAEIERLQTEIKELEERKVDRERQLRNVRDRE